MTGPPSQYAQQKLIALFEARTGQVLSTARSGRIESSLRPLLRSSAIPDIEALVSRIGRGDTGLATAVINALLNNETSFYRDMAVFDLIDQRALSTIAATRRETKRLRIWSAGCATGQEAYSIALLIDAGGVRWDGWTIDILGTDISTSAVARARAGRYSQFEIQRGLPVRTMIKAFAKDGEDWVINPAIRAKVRFGTHNLLDASPGRFDVILCRNVLMYFPLDARTRIFDRLATALEPGGVLALGAGETVIGQTTRFAAHPEWRGLYCAPSERKSARAA